MCQVQKARKVQVEANFLSVQKATLGTGSPMHGDHEVGPLRPSGAWGFGVSKGGFGWFWLPDGKAESNDQSNHIQNLLSSHYDTHLSTIVQVYPSYSPIYIRFYPIVWDPLYGYIP